MTQEQKSHGSQVMNQILELKLEFQDWHFLSRDEFEKHEYFSKDKFGPHGYGPYQHYYHKDKEYYYESENMVLGLYTIITCITDNPNMTPEQFNTLWVQTKVTILKTYNYTRDIQLYDGGICGWNVLQAAWIVGNITLVKHILDLCGNDHNRRLLVNMRVIEKTLVDLFFGLNDRFFGLNKTSKEVNQSFKKQFQLFDCVAPFYQNNKDRVIYKSWFQKYNDFMNNKRWRAMLISSVVEPESIWYQIKHDPQIKTIWEPRVWLIIRQYMYM